MSIKDPKELFVWLLSDVRRREERTTKVFQEMGQVAQDPDVKEALESRVFLENQILSSIDRCFELIGEKPQEIGDGLHDVFVQDFRKELAAIQAPLPKALYIMAKANHLMHLHVGEYVALLAMADITGHYGVGTLLESCLADKLAFVERTRRRIRRIVEREAAGVA